MFIDSIRRWLNIESFGALIPPLHLLACFFAFSESIFSSSEECLDQDFSKYLHVIDVSDLLSDADHSEGTAVRLVGKEMTSIRK